MRSSALSTHQQVQRLQGLDAGAKRLHQVPVALLGSLDYCNVGELPLVEDVLDLLGQLAGSLLTEPTVRCC